MDVLDSNLLHVIGRVSSEPRSVEIAWIQGAMSLLSLSVLGSAGAPRRACSRKRK